jgi:hypothetical protein
VKLGLRGTVRPMTEANEVLATYERYLSSFIDNDLAGIDAVVSYPLTHIGDGEVRTYHAFPIDPAGLKAAKDWHTTVNSRYEVVAISPTKAHVVLYQGEVSYSRPGRWRADRPAIRCSR